MRHFRPPVLAAFLILSIAACTKQDPVDDDVNAVAAAPVTNDSAGAVAGGPPPIDNAAIAAGAIPVAIQGRWGLTPADCTSTRGDAKGLLVIGAGDLKFYESRATPGSSIETDPDSISGNWNFTGEGQNWTRYVSLKLEGNSLVRTERNPVASYTYAKC